MAQEVIIYTKRGDFGKTVAPNFGKFGYNPRDEHAQMSELLNKIQAIAPYVG